MAEMTFERGRFQALRATTKVHLGSITLDINQDDIIEFDGQTLRIGASEYALPQIRSAVREGWFVPELDTTTRYTPKPAGVRVRPAQKAGPEEGEALVMEPASDEERVVGNLTEANARRDAKPAAREPVRPQSSGTPKSSIQTETEPQAAPKQKTATTQNSKYSEDTESEGVPIRRMTTPTHHNPKISDASVVSRGVREFEELTAAAPKRPQKSAAAVLSSEGEDIKARGRGGASGDVESTLSGDTIEELLPAALSTGRPPPGVQGEEAGREPKAPRKATSTRSSMRGSTATDAAQAVEEAPAAKAAAASTKAEFVWDTTRHWRQRVAEAVAKSTNKAWLAQVLSQEKPSVVEQIKQELARRARK